MKIKEPPVPRAQGETVRQQLRQLLRTAPMTAKELSAAAGLPEKEIRGHLEHLRRSLGAGPLRLVAVPPVCRHCGFTFAKRSRLNKPSRCPVCRHETIDDFRFELR